jgi:REP element-mobilizing transposase RayT
MAIKNDDTSSLAHTRWDCKYHIVFTPKYRRKAIYAKLRTDIGKYIRRLCEFFLTYNGRGIQERRVIDGHGKRK